MVDPIFENLAEHFGNAVDIHRKAHIPFQNLQADIESLQSMLNQNTEKQDDSILNLLAAVESTKNNIRTSFCQIGYFEGAFVELVRFIDNRYGLSVDEYLTDVNATVSSSYAKVSQNLGQTISTSNISG